MSMSDKSIKTVINRLNSGDREDIFLQKLSTNVEYGIVWHEVKQFHPFKGKYYKDVRDRFYFIKNESAFYVGAVLVMYEFEELNDLHAYVLKEYRKQGHLFNAMSKIILPHLFQNTQKVRITIDEDRLGVKKYENSKRSASNLGFKSTDGFEFFLTKSDIQLINYVNVEMYTMARDRVKELQEKLKDIANAVEKIDDEFKMTLGCIPKLEELKKDLQDYSSYKLENKYWELISESKQNK